MIGLGAKSLTAAGFGRYRITAASLGRNWMIKPWLTAATWQAIMAAFGVDGTAVIRATNEYLNGIAASDKAKATALAWFINEDPMMVCSLGLEPQGVTMPVRWLVGDGDAYAATSLQGNQNSHIKTRFKDIQANGESDGILFGANVSSGWNGGQLGLQTNASWTYYYFNFNINTNYGSLFNKDLEIELYDGKIYFNGTLIKQTAYNNFTTVYPFNIFAGNWAGSTVYVIKGKVAYWQHIGDTNCNLLPFRLGKARTADQVYPSSKGAQAVGILGLIDTETGLFHPNAASSGAFTMEGEPTP